MTQHISNSDDHNTRSDTEYKVGYRIQFVQVLKSDKVKGTNDIFQTQRLHMQQNIYQITLQDPDKGYNLYREGKMLTRADLLPVYVSNIPYL